MGKAPSYYTLFECGEFIRVRVFATAREAFTEEDDMVEFTL